jgi:hypothetical protein
MIRTPKDEYIGQDIGGTSGGGGTPSAGVPPSLSISNNDNETANGKHNKLLGRHKNSAESLTRQVVMMGEQKGIEKLGFFTITFAGEEPDMEEAMRRFDSLLNGVLRPRYEKGIRNVERGDINQRLHFHMIVAMDEDIKTGFDFAAVKSGDYRSASAYLRAEWAYLRSVLPKYGFGARVEVYPIESNLEGIARYVGSYVAKAVRSRLPGDKGARLWGMWGFKPGEKALTCNFARLTSNRWLWGQKVRIWAASHGFVAGEGSEGSFGVMDRLKDVFGPRWCFHFQEDILAVDIKEHGLEYPSLECLKEDRKILDEIWVPRLMELVDLRDTGFIPYGVDMTMLPMPRTKKYYHFLCKVKMAKIAMLKQIKESSSAPDLRTVTKPDLGERYERRKLIDGLKRENLAAKMDDKRKGALLKEEWENKEFRHDLMMQVADEMESAGGGG